jgi:hypothetical protein
MPVVSLKTQMTPARRNAVYEEVVDLLLPSGVLLRVVIATIIATVCRCTSAPERARELAHGCNDASTESGSCPRLDRCGSASDDGLWPVEVPPDPGIPFPPRERVHLRLGEPHPVADRALLDRYTTVVGANQTRPTLGAAHVGEFTYPAPLLVLAPLVEAEYELPIAPCEVNVFLGALLQLELPSQQIVFSNVHHLQRNPIRRTAQMSP